MKLYSADVSPYSARCRIAIYHKDLPIELAPPPGGLRSEELRAKNPIGKIPVLDLGDQTLAESWAILDYLENRFPETSMRPEGTLAAARQQELAAFADHYLAPAMFPLFLALKGGDVDAQATLDGLAAQLRTFETLIARKATDSTLDLDLADAALVPIVWYAVKLASLNGVANCLEDLPASEAWWARMQANDAARRVIDELDSGLTRMMGGQ